MSSNNQLPNIDMQNISSKKKLICLDTETTGFSNEFDRIIEIGCVDITYGIEKSIHFQRYINPRRSVPQTSFQIHGLNEEFLKNFPPFEKHIDDFLAFIKDATLIIHNANFDIKFLNAELKRYGYNNLTNEVIDTLQLAKKQFPGKKVNLNALKEYYAIQSEKAGQRKTISTIHGKEKASSTVKKNIEKVKYRSNSVNSIFHSSKKENDSFEIDQKKQSKILGMSHQKKSKLNN